MAAIGPEDHVKPFLEDRQKPAWPTLPSGGEVGQILMVSKGELVWSDPPRLPIEVRGLIPQFDIMALERYGVDTTDMHQRDDGEYVRVTDIIRLISEGHLRIVKKPTLKYMKV